MARQPMVSSPASSRYASALFELLKPEGALASVGDELRALAELIRGHEDLRRFLGNPDVEVEDKLRVVERLCASGLSPALRGFVSLVLLKGRAVLLEEIADAFRALVDREQRRMRVVVRTAFPLAEDLKASLAFAIAQRERCAVEISEEHSPDLLGGMQVFVGNRVLDGSLKSQLSRLRERLKSVRVH